MADLSFPMYDSDFIDRVVSGLSPSEICEEYLLTKLCRDILLNSDYSWDCVLLEYADYLLAVLMEEMSVRYVRLCEAMRRSDGSPAMPGTSPPHS